MRLHARVRVEGSHAHDDGLERLEPPHQGTARGAAFGRSFWLEWLLGQRFVRELRDLVADLAQRRGDLVAGAGDVADAGERAPQLEAHELDGRRGGDGL